MNIQPLAKLFSRLWPALLLEGVFFFVRGEMVSSRDNIGAGLILTLLPPFVAAFRMARGPGYLKTATWAGTLFWTAATLLAFAITLATLPVEPPLTRGGVAVAMIFAAMMILPVVVTVALLAGFAARVFAKRATE